jgi:beta-galactosidase GanA
VKIAPVLGAAILLSAAIYAQSDLPTVRLAYGASQILVHGQPYLILGGELGNSSAGTSAEADTILPRLARLHFNTVLMPVAWDEIEPQEGRFDFSIPDHWIDVARQQHLHLVFLWFGAWKNAFSEYAPPWVLADTARFPRVVSVEGQPLAILSPLGEATAQADSHAFAGLLAHLRERDATEQTVLMIQVENEVGYLGLGGRDRSPRANQLFNAPVPAPLLDHLRSHTAELSPRLAAHLHLEGRTWREVFGADADEIFMAWNYGLYVQQVAAAGKAAYPIPLYMNAQLPAPFEQAGDYPSGGPHPDFQAVYRAAAPALDFYAPDIYWPDLASWIERYQAVGNPVFVPEARLDVAPANALYTLGEARGFGFSPFAVDSLPDAPPTALPDASPDAVHAAAQASALSSTYEVLSELSGQILEAQQHDRIRALVLHDDSPRPSQTIALGGYLFRAMLARTWPARQLAATTGAMMVLETAPDEFVVAGSGLTISFLRDPDSDNRIAGIASIEQLAYKDGQWTTARVLNGDQSDQGRALLTDAHTPTVYRVRLYAYGGSK